MTPAEDHSPMESEFGASMTAKSLAADLYAQACDRGESEWRRGAQRRDIREDISIEVPGHKHPVSGFTYQVSPDSMTVCCRQALELETVVIVRRAYVEDGLCDEGTVMHCTQTIGGYKVGIKFS